MTHLLEHLLLGLAQLLILDLPLAELPFQLLDVPAQSQFIPGEGRGRGRQGGEPTGALCSESSCAVCTCRTHGRSPYVGIQGPGAPHCDKHPGFVIYPGAIPLPQLRVPSLWCREVTRPPGQCPPRGRCLPLLNPQARRPNISPAPVFVYCGSRQGLV